MANILNVAQPISGQENANRVSPRHPQEQNVGIYQTPDPTKVQQTKDQNVNPDRQNNAGTPNLESNFEQFMQAIRGSRSLALQYSDLFFSKMGSMVNSGLESGFTAELEKYMSMLKMDEGQLLSMMKGQQGELGKFSGPFFDVMRRLMQEQGPVELKYAVLELLRKYDNLTSSRHILKNLMSNLENIAQRMPQAAARQLQGLMAKMDHNPEQGEHYTNLEILKNEIMPFLGNYVSRTRDFGTVRDLIAMVTLNLARYDAGTESAFLNALRDLLGFSQASKHLSNMPVDEMVAQLSNESTPNSLIDSLANVISSGMKGEAGYQSKAMFQNIAQSILLNESVYMPLIHIMLPAEIDGRQFFSEMWVDPDHREGGGEGEGRCIKLLIKFDIKDLGYFEMVLMVQDGKADMELSYPSALSDKEKEIREKLSDIMSRNKLSFRNLVLSQGVRYRTISEVFPKIYEGRNTINVTI